MKIRGWRDRKLWGVVFHGGMWKEAPMLLGDRWDTETLQRTLRLGEPTRALLFTTRQQARLWCRAMRDRYKARLDCCNKWRFKPVQVTERVTVSEEPSL